MATDPGGFVPEARDLGVTNLNATPFPDEEPSAAFAPLTSDASGVEVEAPEVPDVDPLDAPTELASEPTQVSVELPLPGPDEEPDEPLLGSPHGIGSSAEELGHLPTLPRAELAELDPSSAPALRATDPGELKVERTVVVSGDSVADGARTYALDVRSGQVTLEPEPSVQPRRRSAAGLWIGLALALLVGLSGLGFLAWAIVSTSETEIEARPLDTEPTRTEPARTEPELALEAPAPPSSEVPPPSEGVVESPPAPAGEDPAPDAPAGEPTPDEAEGLEDGADSDANLAVAAPATVTPAAELRGFELEVPRLSRRARRMSAPEQRRQNLRLKGQAARAHREGRFADAERLYREAMEYDTWDVPSAEGLARAIARQGRFAEAIAWGELGVRRSPRSSTAHRILGDVWRQAGHPQEAATVYRRGLSRDPEDRVLRQRLRDVTR